MSLISFRADEDIFVPTESRPRLPALTIYVIALIKGATSVMNNGLWHNTDNVCDTVDTITAEHCLRNGLSLLSWVVESIIGLLAHQSVLADCSRAALGNALEQLYQV